MKTIRVILMMYAGLCLFAGIYSALQKEKIVFHELIVFGVLIVGIFVSILAVIAFDIMEELVKDESGEANQ